MYAKDFLNNIGETKKKDNATIINDITKGTVVGALIGAGVGLYIGFSRHKNLLLSSFIGSVIGGGISRAFILKK
jgi:uncharacterized protein YcfJ